MLAIAPSSTDIERPAKTTSIARRRCGCGRLASRRRSVHGCFGTDGDSRTMIEPARQCQPRRPQPPLIPCSSARGLLDSRLGLRQVNADARHGLSHRRPARHRRGADRVPAGVLDRAFDLGRRAARHRGPGEQALRYRDPTRRDPRGVLGLSRALHPGRRRASPRTRSRSASSPTSSSPFCRRRWSGYSLTG